MVRVAELVAYEPKRDGHGGAVVCGLLVGEREHEPIPLLQLPVVGDRGGCMWVRIDELRGQPFTLGEDDAVRGVEHGVPGHVAVKVVVLHGELQRCGDAGDDAARGDDPRVSHFLGHPHADDIFGVMVDLDGSSPELADAIVGGNDHVLGHESRRRDRGIVEDSRDALLRPIIDVVVDRLRRHPDGVLRKRPLADLVRNINAVVGTTVDVDNVDARLLAPERIGPKLDVVVLSTGSKDEGRLGAAVREAVIDDVGVGLRVDQRLGARASRVEPISYGAVLCGAFTDCILVGADRSSGRQRHGRRHDLEADLTRVRAVFVHLDIAVPYERRAYQRIEAKPDQAGAFAATGEVDLLDPNRGVHIPRSSCRSERSPIQPEGRSWSAGRAARRSRG